MLTWRPKHGHRITLRAPGQPPIRLLFSRPGPNDSLQIRIDCPDEVHIQKERLGHREVLTAEGLKWVIEEPKGPEPIGG